MIDSLRGMSRQKQMFYFITVCFVILPLTIATIVLAIQALVGTSTKEEAFSTDIEESMAISIESKTPNAIFHKIAQDGEWTAIQAISTAPKNYGDVTVVIVQKQNDQYNIVYTGTNTDQSMLESLGIPSSIISAVNNKSTKNSQYRNTVIDASTNPRNKYSLIQKLPFSTDRYKIECSFKDGQYDAQKVATPTIQITGDNATQRLLAIRKIKNFGYDPGYYNIEFINFINPMTGDNK